MVRVMASGVFDILHVGHLHFLEEAKKLGDELVVVVANDDTVRKMKHEPVTPEKMRAELVGSLKVVDRVVIGGRGDPYQTVVDVKPEIIALGYDQHWKDEDIRAELARRSLDVQVVRLKKFDTDLNGTRKIIQKVIEMWTIQRQLQFIESMPAHKYKKGGMP